MTEQRFPTPRPITLEVKVAAGDIDVRTVDGEESTVALEGSPQVLENVRVELVGDRLRVEQRGKSGLGWFGRAYGQLRVTAAVPSRSQIEIATAASNATLEGAFAGVELRSASGDLVVNGELDGDAVVRTVSGSVRLPAVAGELRVQTVSGDVAAESVDGSVAVKSVSGDVRIGSLREGNVVVQSVSGDVELGVASGASLDVDAGSASGEVSSEIPLFDAPGEDAPRKIVIRSSSVSGDFRVFRAA
ncbi:MAG TPA: DUF4097 family beta strand repeat-containing protein [Solirubrobacteraceae bacterium]|nr:DUF4097 family beta strand repeat-containing protein [Solirubrobacteraceae bacterium]